MTSRLNGKKALVTGAAAGIGRATVLAFLSAGARVLATDKDDLGLRQLAAEAPSVETSVLDVTDPEAIAALTAESPDIDILFNCAGFVPHGTILDCGPEDWRRAFELNVTSIFLMARAFLPGMLERSRGNIINVASVVSNIKAAPNRFAYATTKAAVIGLTKSIAVDYIGNGIRCNAICPGTVDTPSLADRIAAQGDPVKVRAAFIARQPMGRLGTAEEIAALALHLASDESAFATGGAFVIDGGFSL